MHELSSLPLLETNYFVYFSLALRASVTDNPVKTPIRMATIMMKRFAPEPIVIASIVYFFIRNSKIEFY